MRLSSQHSTNYPEPLLREWANSALGARRCSADYLAALRTVLGNMSLADRLGVKLTFCIKVDFTTERTMRTILGQLRDAGQLQTKAWIDSLGRPHQSAVYRGRMVADHERNLYVRLQRAQEEVDFHRSMHALGLEAADCPY
jgi:hypothetical protein